MQDVDVIIIGAGAAGLMCAAGAIRRGRKVVVLERNPKVAQKVRISGGGRANFTNLHAAPVNFLSDNPHFCVSALKRYTQHDFIALVESHRIAYHEKTLGQLFCDDSAQQIIDMLLAEAHGADIRTAITVSAVTRDGDRFRVETDKGVFTGAALVIATGGPSIPKMGASGFAYDIARQFGLRVVTPRAGLVPLTFDAAMLANLEGLSGVSVDATATLGKVRFAEALLFTHRGLSGPVILQISSYWKPGDAITLDLLPGRDLFSLLKEMKQSEPKKEVPTVLSQFLAKSLAQRLCEWTGCLGLWPTSRTNVFEPWLTRSMPGPSPPTAARATARPRSPSAGSIRGIFHPRPWKPGTCRGSISLARAWTSRATWAGSISNGLGRRAMPAARWPRSHQTQLNGAGLPG